MKIMEKLMKPLLNAERRDGIQEGEEIGIQKGEEIGIQKGQEIGRREGQEIGRQEQQKEHEAWIARQRAAGATFVDLPSDTDEQTS